MEYYHQSGLLYQFTVILLYIIIYCYYILNLNANIMLKYNKIMIFITLMFILLYLSYLMHCSCSLNIIILTIDKNKIVNILVCISMTSLFSHLIMKNIDFFLSNHNLSNKFIYK